VQNNVGNEVQERDKRSKSERGSGRGRKIRETKFMN
jgi:hypothetical protein